MRLAYTLSDYCHVTTVLTQTDPSLTRYLSDKIPNIN